MKFVDLVFHEHVNAQHRAEDQVLVGIHHIGCEGHLAQIVSVYQLQINT